MCERIKKGVLPHYVSLDKIRNEEGPYLKLKQDEQKAIKDKEMEENRPKVPPPTEKYFDILPMPRHTLDRSVLEETLSIRKNAYLACRWNKFLNENKNDPYIKIKLFAVPHDVQVPRKFSMSGRLYDHNFLEAPIPSTPDPRGTQYLCQHHKQRASIQKKRF